MAKHHMEMEFRKELNAALSGGYMVALDVTAFHANACIGTRVLEREKFLACLIGHLPKMFEANPTAIGSFLEQGTFLLEYPPEFLSYVSPQCAPHSRNPEDYVVRQGNDGVCRAYLKRNSSVKAEQVWVGGMTREKYMSVFRGELEKEEIDCIRSFSSEDPLVIIINVYGDMLYPIQDIPEESIVLPPTLERALEVIQECGKMNELKGREDTDSLTKHIEWVNGYVDYALGHNRRFAWVAD